MKKYRILEINNCFYPQEKRWFSWVYLDNLISRLTWGESLVHQSECESKECAEKVIEKRIKYLGSGKKIVREHEYKVYEYKQQDK